MRIHCRPDHPIMWFLFDFVNWNVKLCKFNCSQRLSTSRKSVRCSDQLIDQQQQQQLGSTNFVLVLRSFWSDIRRICLAILIILFQLYFVAIIIVIIYWWWWWYDDYKQIVFLFLTLQILTKKYVHLSVWLYCRIFNYTNWRRFCWNRYFPLH